MAATYTIIENRHPYYLIEVEFDGESFLQETLFPQPTETARLKAMQAYADLYDKNFVPTPDVSDQGSVGMG